MTPKTKRPPVLGGTTYMVETGCGKLFATINNTNADPAEVFLKLGSQGSCPSAFMAALGCLISYSLRAGIPLGVFQKALASATCPKARREVVDVVYSNGEPEEVVVETPSCMAAFGQLIGDLVIENHGAQPASGPLSGTLEEVPTGCGGIAVGCFGQAETLTRVTAEIGAAGSCASAIGSSLAKCINIALANGLNPAAVAKALTGIHCPQSNHSCASCIDAIGKQITKASTPVE